MTDTSTKVREHCHRGTRRHLGWFSALECRGKTGASDSHPQNHRPDGGQHEYKAGLCVLILLMHKRLFRRCF